MNLFYLVLFSFVLAGCGGSGGGGEGEAEGGEGGGHDGGTGDGGGGGEFVSDGMSLGAYESVPLAGDESFAGILGDTEVAVHLDGALFVGRLRNEGTQAVCDVRAWVTLDGLAGEPVERAGLSRFGRSEIELPAHAEFTNWTVAVETSGCSSAPSGDGGEGGGGSEGSEGVGEHGGGGEGDGEGGGEHGSGGEGSGEGSEGGDESGDESSPPIPLTDAYANTIGDQAFHFAYDAAVGVFRGTVENVSNAVICESRTEMHLGAGTDVIELGPTIPVDLAAGETMRLVMSAGGYAVETYSLHPERSPCR